MAEHVFRVMGKEDVDAIAQMEKLCFDDPWSKGALEDELLNPASQYSILEVDGEIVGYAGMWVVIDEAYVTNVAVHPEQRKRGYGEEIMRELLRQAVKKGATKMTLEVRASNTVAQTLYYKLGFKKEGIRKGFYQNNHEDALILWNRDIAALCPAHPDQI